jgi:amino acid adenylation domain-containing protein
MNLSGQLVSYHLTPMQQGMLYHRLIAPRSGIDVVQVVGTLLEPLDLQQFRKAWQRIVDRHESLRMRVRIESDGVVRQFPLEHVMLPVVEIDWSHYPLEKRERLLGDFLEEDRLRGFDPRVETTIRVKLFRFASEDYRMVFTWWHGTLDGRSNLILIRELFTCYDALRCGREIVLPLPRSFTEYTEWLAGCDAAAAIPYWTELLEGFTTPTPMGNNRLLSAQQNSNRGKRELSLPLDLTERLHAAVKEQGITMNTLLHGAWALVLGSYSGEEDVVFGAIRNCRRSAFDGDGTGAGIVGTLINTVPVRIKMPGELRVRDWLKGLRAQSLAMRPYELSSLVAVQACSGVPADYRLFDSVMVYEYRQLDAELRAEGEDWPHRSFDMRGVETGYPVTLIAFGYPRLKLMMLHDHAIIDDQTARRMLEHFAMALRSLAESADALLSEINVLPEAEQHLVLREWNRTSCPFDAEGSIQRSFNKQVERTPEAPALSSHGETWTYRQLDQRAEAIARMLRKVGARPETVVGICMERSLDLVAGMLGILKSGAAYLPLDPSYPSDRINFMIRDAQPLLVVTSRSTDARLSAAGVLTMCLCDETVLCSADAFPDSSEEGLGGHDLAYLIYTSGSTGKPKGVMVEHRNVMNYYAGMDAILDRETGIWLAVTSVSFDPSVLDLFWPLTRGSHVVLWPGVEQIGTIPGLIREYGVTHMFCVPSFLRLLLMLPGATEALKTLRCIVSGGEPLTQGLIRDLRLSDTLRFVNIYGPTETTVASTAWKVETETEPIPIGPPLANTQVYVLDRHRRPVPVGTVGELYIGGEGVARGYLRRPELTAERFLPNPFGGNADELMYRTGDLVRYRSDGALEYIGRSDNQVKIRGHRMELGEIEAVLGRNPALRAAVVDVQDGADGGKRLVAYVVPKPEGMPQVKEIREWLGREIPEYMVPSAFIVLDELPRTPNGKLDRRALPSFAESGFPSGEVEREPTVVEAKLAEIWCDVLGRKQVGLDANFFDLGGDSLAAVSLTASIQKRLGVEVPLEILLSAPTVAQLADRLNGAVGLDRDVHGRTESAEGYLAPRSLSERRVQGIWEMLLEVRPIGIRDGFFELGGDHALFDRMMSELRRAFGIFTEGLPISEETGYITIEAIARLIDECVEPSSSLVVCLQSKGSRCPLFLIHAGGGYVFFYRALASRLGPNRPVYGVRAETSADGMGQPFERTRSVEQLAARYIAEIRRVRPTGPYLLGGACFGGVVAFEMARQLRAHGEIVGPLLAIDAFIRNNPEARDTDLAQASRALNRLRDRISNHLSHAADLRPWKALPYVSGVFWRSASSRLFTAIRTVWRKLPSLLSCLEKMLPGRAGSTSELKPFGIMKEYLEVADLLLFKYIPGAYDGSMLQINADLGIVSDEMWNGLVLGDLSVYTMFGCHLEMMDEPAVRETAALVSGYLDRYESALDSDCQLRLENVHMESDCSLQDMGKRLDGS